MLRILRKKMKSILIAVAVIFAASMFYGISMSRSIGGGSSGNRGFAKVNGKEVDPYRYREFINRLVHQLGDEVNPQNLAFVENLALGQTIDFMLILSEAKKKVRISGREIDMAIAGIIKKEKLSSKRDLERALKRVGMDLRRFRTMLKEEMLVQKMTGKIRSVVQVTPDDLREVEASHILVSEEAEAQALLVRVKGGENFATLAGKYSMDPGSRSKGGNLGYFGTGTMVESFEKAAFTLKVGEISEIIKSPFGYHIIKVTDSRLRKFEGKEKDIEKAALAEKQQKVFQKWYSELRQGAKIEILSPKLRGHDFQFRGKIWEAIAEYKKAILQNPSNPYLHVFLGDVYNVIGKTDLALSEYEAAVAAEGGNLGLYEILAKAYQKAGKRDLALKQYKRASMVAGDDKAQHERLLKIFKDLKAWKEYRQEKAEIARIEKKEKFEKELTGEK